MRLVNAFADTLGGVGADVDGEGRGGWRWFLLAGPRDFGLGRGREGWKKNEESAAGERHEQFPWEISMLARLVGGYPSHLRDECSG